MKMKSLWAAGLLASVLSASSCGMIPVEEPLRTAPKVAAYVDQGYVTAACSRDNVENTTLIHCTYQALQTDNLSFKIGGIRYDEFFAKVGDAVKKGQLLAQLDPGTLEVEKSSLSLRKDELILKETQLEEDRELAVRREVQYAADNWLTEEQKAERVASVNEQYDKMLQGYEDELTVVEIRLEHNESELQKRKIYAPYDGVITYVYDYASSDASEAYKRVMVIADSSMSVFMANTEYAGLLKEGDTFTVNVSKVDYEATVMDPESIGIVDNNEKHAYLVLSTPAFELEEGNNGSFTLLLDAAYDVLTVPKRAISKINGETVVYYPDENGMKQYKNVSIGVVSSTRVEILSGLSEGEVVIID